MTSLYQRGYRPIRLSKSFEATSFSNSDAAAVMHRQGVPADYGDPVDAVAFFHIDNGSLGALTCDYANGRRAEYRQTKNGSRLSMTTPGEQA